MRPEPTWRDRLGVWLGRWWAEFTSSDALVLDWERLWEFDRRQAERERAWAEQPVPVKLGRDVLAQYHAYMCALCGNTLRFEPVASEEELARQAFGIGSCWHPTCRLYNVRLKVPLTVLPNCEILEEPVQL
jgi:hypothetical protein